MLTESEKAWLERREEMPGYYCLWCPLWDDEADCDGRSPHPFCPIFQRRERLWDAAEFEARVAAKLADIKFHHELGNPDSCRLKYGKCANPSRSCVDCRLNAARIAVEEEMDNEP